MMFLLDTNAFSDLMRKHSKLEALRRFKVQGFKSSMIDAVLITRDTDFQHIEGLSVNDWTV
jgi:predicted nucleic acid-binding protein